MAEEMATLESAPLMETTGTAQRELKSLPIHQVVVPAATKKNTRMNVSPMVITGIAPKVWKNRHTRLEASTATVTINLASVLPTGIIGIAQRALMSLLILQLGIVTMVEREVKVNVPLMVIIGTAPRESMNQTIPPVESPVTLLLPTNPASAPRMMTTGTVRRVFKSPPTHPMVPLAVEMEMEMVAKVLVNVRHMATTGIAPRVSRNPATRQDRPPVVVMVRLLENVLRMEIIGTVRKASKNLPILQLKRKRVDSQLSLLRQVQASVLPTGITGIVPKAFRSHHTHQLESRVRLSRL